MGAPAPSISSAQSADLGSQSGTLVHLKNWFRHQNRRGRLIWAQRAWRHGKSLYHFHPRQRFLNSSAGWLGTLLGFWHPIRTPPCVIQRRFYVFTQESKTGKRVIKLARGDEKFSCDLIKALKTPTTLVRYEKILKGIKQDRWLQNHSVAVYRIRPDGGYVSEYVEGINLAQLRDEFFSCDGPEKPLRDGLLHAIKQLLENLTAYCQAHGHLVGDWALHNLLYCPALQSIINVDVEGFFSYSDGLGEASLQFVETNLLNLAGLLRLMDRSSAEDSRTLDLFRVVDEVRRSGEQYSGAAFVVGYHTLELCGRKFRGQRDCAERLAQVPLDFRGKVVLDLGCNVGGMLHSLSKVIKHGYGFDYNSNCINVAHLITRLNHSENLDFFTFDLDRQDLSLLPCYLPQKKVDICFLMSMCCWLDRWDIVLRAASQLADTMLFESNGSSRQQEDQLALLRTCFTDVSALPKTPAMTSRWATVNSIFALGVFPTEIHRTAAASPVPLLVGEIE